MPKISAIMLAMRNEQSIAEKKTIKVKLKGDKRSELHMDKKRKAICN